MFGGALIISGAVDSLMVLLGSSLSTIPLFELFIGGTSLVYGIVVRPGSSIKGIPLGAIMLSLGSAVMGTAALAAGVFASVLPANVFISLGAFPFTDQKLRLIQASGIVLAMAGVGLLYLAKGLWEREYWALVVASLASLAGIALGIFQIFLFLGNPVFSIFLFWYLRRPNVQEWYAVPGAN